MNHQLTAAINGKPKVFPLGTAPHLKQQILNCQRLAHDRVRFSWFSFASATKR
jgi:hypothetical protein